ncbi:MAG: DUF2127 domain-containing protein [Acidobacteriales bacterium]|nr:DUF2127 domain-containing protein [Terriglobales bacterium]
MSVAAGMPVAHKDHNSQLKVLRAVASIELVKGGIALAAGISVLFLVHRDAWEIADRFLEILHISPDRHFAQMFLDWADTLTPAKLWGAAAVAAGYSTLRFVEAYGLWKARAWGEWIALVSGILYMPVTVFWLAHKPNPFHVVTLLVNLAIVIYMGYLLWASRAAKGRQLT